MTAADYGGQRGAKAAGAAGCPCAGPTAATAPLRLSQPGLPAAPKIGSERKVSWGRYRLGFILDSGHLASAIGKKSL